MFGNHINYANIKYLFVLCIAIFLLSPIITSPVFTQDENTQNSSGWFSLIDMSNREKQDTLTAWLEFISPIYDSQILEELSSSIINEINRACTIAANILPNKIALSERRLARSVSRVCLSRSPAKESAIMATTSTIGTHAINISEIGVSTHLLPVCKGTIIPIILTIIIINTNPTISLCAFLFILSR